MTTRAVVKKKKSSTAQTLPLILEIGDLTLSLAP